MMPTPRLRGCARLALGATISVGVALVFVVFSRGGIPWSYAVNVGSLDGAVWVAQVGFILWQTFSLHLPLILLAILGMIDRPRAVLPMVIWYLSYLGVYSLWHWRYEAWWWMRYMLPALPAVFLAAVEGADVLVRSVAARRGRRLLAGVGGAVMAGYVAWTFCLSPARRHLTTKFDQRYPNDVAAVSRIVPAGSLVGAFGLSGPLRLYARYQSFYWCHADAAALVRWAADAGRPVYTVLDDDELRCNPGAASAAMELGYGLNVMERLPSGRTVHRLGPP